MKEFIRKVLKEEEGMEWAKDTSARQELKYSTVTINYVDYYDLENFMVDYYGDERLPDFSIPSDLESSNDTTHELSANANEEPWDKDLFDAWKRGENDLKSSGTNHRYQPNVHDLLNDLAKEGVIPDGEWFVRVSW